MQQILIDITGKPFPQLMQEYVLGPLGMAHSTFDQPLPKNLAASPVTPYLGTGEEVNGGAHIYPEMAAAGLWTTASDLARFALAVQDSLADRPGAIPLSAAQMVATKLGKRGVMFLSRRIGRRIHISLTVVKTKASSATSWHTRRKAMGL